MVISKRVEGTTVIIGFSRSYQCSFSAIQQLVELAKRDFPALKDEDIAVVKFLEHPYRGKTGIIFSVPNGNEPGEAYERVADAGSWI